MSTLTSGAGLLSEYSGPEIPLYSKNLLQALNSLIDLFQKENTAGQTDVYIEVLTITTTAAPLYTNPKPVRGGTLMNLSSTDSITISSWGKGAMGKVTPLTAGQGYIMNPSNVAGMGGGTFNFGSVDLSTIMAVTNINTGQKMVAAYYQ